MAFNSFDKGALEVLQVSPAQIKMMESMGFNKIPQALDFKKEIDQRENAKLKDVLRDLGSDFDQNLPKYQGFLSTLGQQVLVNGQVVRNNSIVDRLSADLTADPTLSESLKTAIRNNPDAVARLMPNYNQGSIALKAGLAEINGTPAPVVSVNANNTAPKDAPPPAPITPVNQTPSHQEPINTGEIRLPATLDRSSFDLIGVTVAELADKVFPGNERAAQKSALETKFRNTPEFYAEFKREYDSNPNMRKTYQDLMDLAARQARETNPDGSPKEMSATVRGALQGPMGKILNDPTKLHNKDFLHTEIDPLIANANNPMMAMFGKAFDFIKGFFGNFLQSLGFTGPEKWHQLGGGFMDMFKGGMGKLGDMFGFDGAAIAGNAGGGLLGDFMGGIQRAFGMESATRTLLHADGAPPVEYVFLKNGQNVGHGYLLEPLKDEAGNNIRDTQYAKNIDENGRGRNFTTIPDNDGLIPKSQWDAQEAQRRLQQQGQQAGLNNAAPAAGPGGGGGIS